MKTLNKIIAILLIATFLASIPMVFAQEQPQYKGVINVLRDDTNFSKPNGVGGVNGKPTTTSADYLLLGYKGSIKNPLLTVYVKDETSGGVSLLSAVQLGAEEWDSHTKGQLFSAIVDSQTIEIETSGLPDYKNEIVYGGTIEGDSNIIAVTYTWYNTRTKAIVEFDMVLNAADYSWGNGQQSSSVM